MQRRGGASDVHTCWLLWENCQDMGKGRTCLRRSLAPSGGDHEDRLVWTTMEVRGCPWHTGEPEQSGGSGCVPIEGPEGRRGRLAVSRACGSVPRGD